MPTPVEQAKAFLAGEQILFKDADALWKELKGSGEISLGWSVLARMRKDNGAQLIKGLPKVQETLDKLCQQQAMLMSKDPELPSTIKHDRALRVLEERFALDDSRINTDSETLGIAGGICKRKWDELGQYEDLIRSASFYQRAAGNPMGEDAYAQINAAFLQDLVAAAEGEDSRGKELPGNVLRQKIADELPPSENWFNTATRAEAFVGLGQYEKAENILKEAKTKPQAWELQTTTRQFANLAHLREDRPLANPKLKAVFDALLPHAPAAVSSATLGKVGLALSGGGFRASFYHLGVLARLAELDILRHVEVLSCVSGGSIIGACYWLALRRRMLKKPAMTRQDYLALVQDLIATFEENVAKDLRSMVQPSRALLAIRMIRSRDIQGVLNPEEVANALEEHFLKPLWDGLSPSIMMSDLPFTPADHDSALSGSPLFDLGKHNWLRENKVPALVLNATSVNTGRGWQFTATWMGESPWALNEGADNIERLEWARYDVDAHWQIELARAIAASAAVPGVFSPLELSGEAYPDVRVQLVDGGVNDNQGIVSLLAMNCNVLLASDASGQLRLERGPSPGVKGFISYANRAMDVLMERVRQATFADLVARKRTRAIRGLMFLHMKAGLDAETIRLNFSQETFEAERTALSPSGVRKDFQRALSELRTDLNEFTVLESRALMACGYKMAAHGFEKQLAAEMPDLGTEPEAASTWAFSELLKEITSTAPATPNRVNYLNLLREGSKVQFFQAGGGR